MTASSGFRIEGFAARARAELAVTGDYACSRTEGSPVQLTPQELQIARMAAGGATSRAIAAQLFLSAATVNFHLGNVYRKLGIGRRAALTLALLDTGLSTEPESLQHTSHAWRTTPRPDLVD